MVVFNPSTVTVTNWGDIPAYNLEVEHNAANIKDGHGDPCRLVGFTEQEIKNATNAATPSAFDKGEFRLPTSSELGAFVNKSGQTSWVP